VITFLKKNCIHNCDVWYVMHVVVGLDDLSVEEVRLNAYEAIASGNFNAYVSMLYHLVLYSCVLLFVFILFFSA